tara:strand:+ start:34776 stop:35357 length:582 start_codon:yes stop_codon:yes gene_type:complete
MNHSHTEAIQKSLTHLLLSTYITTDSAEHLLLNAGWFLHSSEGCFSNVYRSPCGQYILRVGHSYADREDKYPFHACNAILNEDNPYFPKIYWHVQSIFRHFDEPLTLTLMEVLNPIDNPFKSYDCKLISEAVPVHSDEVIIPQQAFENNALAKALYSLGKVMEKHGLESDISLGNGNLMQRPSGEIVITDPYC